MLRPRSRSSYVWLHCPLDLAPDEAHYWDWSRHLDWSYYSKGPLVAWLIRGSCELFGPLSVELTGDLAAAVRLPAVICHAATLDGPGTFWQRGVFRSSRLGLCGRVARGLRCRWSAIGAVVMTIDPPFLACWSWALVCVWRALGPSGGLGWWLAAALLCAVGHPGEVHDGPSSRPRWWAYLLVHRRQEFRRRWRLGFARGDLVGWLPILYWNATHDWVTFRHVFGQVGTGKRSGLPLVRSARPSWADRSG